MRIAVCDDDEGDLNRICQLLAACGAPAPDRYCEASALLEAAARYDAVFLDIEMQAPNGYDVARQLIRRTPHPLIVFVTQTDAYAVRGYGVAFRYLLKPISPDALSGVLRDVESELRENRIPIVADGVRFVLDVREILYAEVLNHTVILHTADGSYTFRSSLNELRRQLPEAMFCAPHQSYLVNLQQIRAAGAQSLVLSNGDVVPLSRRQRQQFLQRFHAMLGGLP